MQAAINGTHTIRDYFRLAYDHNPLVRYVVQYTTKTRKWPLTAIEGLALTPMDTEHQRKTMCSLDLQGGHKASIEIIHHNDGSFQAGKSRGGEQ